MNRAVSIGSGLLGALLLATSCAPAATAPAPAAAGGGVLVPVHAAGLNHEKKPNRVDPVVEIDLRELSFDNPKKDKNPVFRIPAGKTVGLHFHNEGTLMHELVIGRGAIKYEEVQGKQVPAEYTTNLFEEVQGDLFFYYGADRVEVGGAKFGEIELPVGMRDAWVRVTVPANLKGEWEIGCFVEGHYEGGMKAKLIVE